MLLMFSLRTRHIPPRDVRAPGEQIPASVTPMCIVRLPKKDLSMETLPECIPARPWWTGLHIWVRPVQVSAVTVHSRLTCMDRCFSCCRFMCKFHSESPQIYRRLLHPRIFVLPTHTQGFTHDSKSRRQVLMFSLSAWAYQ